MSRISFLRIDADMFSSTRDVLHRLYPLVSVGGIVYVDDYGSFAGCAAAVDRFLATRPADERPNAILEDAVWGKDLSGNSYPYDGSDGTQVCAGRLRGANCSIHAVWWVKRSL